MSRTLKVVSGFGFVKTTYRKIASSRLSLLEYVNGFSDYIFREI